MKRNLEPDYYVIGREDIPGQPAYYAEGFGFGPVWTGRSLANGYSNRRDALREARRVGGYVTRRHNPFRTPDVRITR